MSFRSCTPVLLSLLVACLCHRHCKLHDVCRLSALNQHAFLRKFPVRHSFQFPPPKSPIPPPLFPAVSCLPGASYPQPLSLRISFCLHPLPGYPSLAPPFPCSTAFRARPLRRPRTPPPCSSAVCPQSRPSFPFLPTSIVSTPSLVDRSGSLLCHVPLFSRGMVTFGAASRFPHRDPRFHPCAHLSRPICHSILEQPTARPCSYGSLTTLWWAAVPPEPAGSWLGRDTVLKTGSRLQTAVLPPAPRRRLSDKPVCRRT